MKQIIAFDLDGTLAPSKSPTPNRIINGLTKLLDSYTVCVISGGQYRQFETQLLSGLDSNNPKLSRLHLMPCCGTQYYTYNQSSSRWERQYIERLSDDEKTRTIAAANEALDSLGYREREVYGDVIEDRDSQITVSALGQDIVEMLGQEGLNKKEAWDPDSKKKNAIRDFMAERLPDLEVRVGGISSIDTTKPGIDKAYGMQKLLDMLSLQKSDALFIGDRLQPGGNDYPVLKMGVTSLEVSCWEETAMIIDTLCAVAE